MQECFIEGPAVSCYGLRIGFRANQQCLVAKLDSILPPNWQPAQSASLDFVYSFKVAENGDLSKVYLGSEELIRSQNMDALLSQTASHIEHTVAEHARESIFIHAGVVGWLGRAILFPGRSSTGKSTLVRALLGQGAAYYSDEFAVIDSVGLVHPFPRPLSLRAASGKIILHPAQIGADIGSKPIPVAAIVLTEYAPNGIWQPDLLSRGHAMLGLLGNTVAIRSSPARSMEYVKHLTRSSVTIHSIRGEAEITVPLLLKTVDEFTNHKKRHERRQWQD